MNKKEFKELDREQMIIAFNQLKDDYSILFDELEKEKEKNELFVLSGNSINLERHIKNNYISKDKIKEKIEELEKEQKEYKNSQEWEIQDDIVAQINILKDLLEV